MNPVEALRRSFSNRARRPHLSVAVVAILGGSVVAGPISPAAAQVQSPSESAPPMERVPAGDEWELEFVPKALRVHIDEATGRAYWVLTYEVGNRTDRPRTWAPVFEIQGDGGPVQRSGLEVPSMVADDVKRMLNRSKVAERPPVLDQNQAIGLLPVGRAHVRDGFAIWPVADHPEVVGYADHPNELVVYVGGVSNRRGTVRHPITGKDVVLRQQQAVRFETPGRVESLVGDALKPISTTLIYR